jgi:hypothetical protein
MRAAARGGLHGGGGLHGARRAARAANGRSARSKPATFMKHKKVLNYEVYFLFLLDAPLRARFGPSLGVSAVLLVARASKRRGPMHRNSTSARGDRRRQLMPSVLVGHELSETTLPKSACSVSVDKLSAFPMRRLKFSV